MVKRLTLSLDDPERKIKYQYHERGLGQLSIWLSGFHGELQKVSTPSQTMLILPPKAIQIQFWF
jgi:hypothetical protein